MGKEDFLTAGMHFLPRLDPWVSMHVNYYGRKLAPCFALQWESFLAHKRYGLSLSLPFPSLSVFFLWLVLCIDQTSCGKDTLRTCILVCSNLCNRRMRSKQPPDLVFFEPLSKLRLFCFKLLRCLFLKPRFSRFLPKHSIPPFLSCKFSFSKKICQKFLLLSGIKTLNLYILHNGFWSFRIEKI